jgi:hypothetical protein
MPSPRLDEFVVASKSKGASDEFLVTFLARRGWGTHEVDEALGRYWESATGISVPHRKKKGPSAREAFLYLLSFFTLATWSAALGSICFEFINRWIPDALSPAYVYNLRSRITWQMASIAVAFPVYLLVMRVVLREAQDPERPSSGIRNWLTYIAMLVTAGAMIGDLICFLDYFLTGELTLRFVMKSGTVMAICGGIFGYYLGSLRGRRNRSFGLAATVAVTAAFCTGLIVAGPPASQRRFEADRRRVQDLREAANVIKAKHDQVAALPDSLSGIGNADPATGAPYEYRKLGASGYQLCAVFGGATEEPQNVTVFWRHAAGRQCFTLDAAKPVPW